MASIYRLVAGEIDDIEDAQPAKEDAPKLDSSLVGWKIDVRWRYWITDPTRASVSRTTSGAKARSSRWPTARRTSGRPLAGATLALSI